MAGEVEADSWSRCQIDRVRSSIEVLAGPSADGEPIHRVAVDTDAGSGDRIGQLGRP